MKQIWGKQEKLFKDSDFSGSLIIVTTMG